MVEPYICTECDNPMSVNMRGPVATRCVECKKKKAAALVRAWRKKHPERNKQVNRAAGKRYDRKRRGLTKRHMPLN